MQSHVSEHLGYKDKGHKNFDFLDVDLYRDNLLFIDPCLLSRSSFTEGIEAGEVLQDFFDCLYESLRNGDKQRFYYLLSHSRECNATKLGYGNGENGRGNSPLGLATKFWPLWTLIKAIPFEKPMDVPVFIKRFDKDGMSDLITNVARQQLYLFTKKECEKVNMPFLTMFSHWFWDRETHTWKQETVAYPTYGSKPILVVPKDCVRDDYVYNVSDFLSRSILERRKQESKYTDKDGKERYTTKKEFLDRIPKDSPNWRNTYSENYTRENPGILSDYHERIDQLYASKRLSDDKLDYLIY